MLRALAWKEWREQWTVVAAGVGITIALPFFLMAGASARARGFDPAEVAALLPMFYAVLVWPLFAAAAGAATVATEVGEGSLGFLLSRPVSRTRVWAVKVLLAATAVLAIVMATLASSAAVSRLANPGGETSVPAPWDTTGGLLSGVLLAGASILLFGVSVFFSTVLSRTMTAAAAGIATSLVLLSGMLFVWARVDVVPHLEPEWLAAETALAGLLFLGASWWAFTRGEMLRGRRFLRTAVGAAVLALGVFGLASLPMLHATVRLTPEEAVLRDLQLASDGRGLVAYATSDGVASGRVWWVPADGSGMQPLTGRLTLSPALSPDGRWVAYLSLRGPLGLRARRLALRAVRTDGTGEQRLLADTGEPDAAYAYLYSRVAFAPSGDRLAVLVNDRVLVTSLSGGALQERDLSPLDLRGALLIGWTPDGREIVLYRHRVAAQGESALVAVDLDSGGTRNLLATRKIVLWPWVTAPRPLAGRHLVVVATTTGDPAPRTYEALLLDVVDGTEVSLARGPCAARMDMAPDRGVLAYSTCETENGASWIRLRDLESGQDRDLAAIPGSVMRLFLSPRGDRVLLRMRSDHGERTLTVGADGTVHRFDPVLRPVGWSGRDRVILMDPEGATHTRLLVARADGSETRAIFP